MNESRMKVEEELEKYMDAIKREAYKCYLRVKKPTIHSVEDLIQDGVVIFYRAYEMFCPETAVCEFGAYVYRALINGYNHTRLNSWMEGETARPGQEVLNLLAVAIHEPVEE